VASVALTLPASSGNMVASGDTYTASLTNPQRKGSRVVRPGERGGQMIGPYLQIDFSSNLQFYEFRSLLDEMWRRSVLFEEYDIENNFFKNMCDEFLPHT
jgi:hypothetical protein